LQIHALCLVFLTGTFLNIVAINIRMVDSFIGSDVTVIEQR